MYCSYKYSIAVVHDGVFIKRCKYCRGNGEGRITTFTGKLADVERTANERISLNKREKLGTREDIEEEEEEAVLLVDEEL